ncbi:MAG TPA: SMP-30/gluconolactonase/LRE family protein [Thermoanaerobaculia bacterium]|nr:SMP-30/gluconolactonase/LRE family protein [Thermoanaerobaculia bacterium]
MRLGILIPLVAALLFSASGSAQEPIIAPGARLETLFSGGVFTEGPAAAPDGTIYFSDITGSARSREAGHLMRYDPRTGEVIVYRSPSGMANGIAFDLEGRMIVAEGADFGGRRVTRTDMASGKSERLATHFGGRRLNSPNDVTVDARGRIWFSDPRYVGDEPIEQPVQGVYRIDPDGSLHLVVADAGKPNGLAVSPDQKTLYVASTDNGATGALPEGMSPRALPLSILAYDLGEDGSARLREVLVEFGEEGFADGLTVDLAGNLYCGCGPLGVRVWSPDGRELATIPTPASATNVEFGRGADRRTLYVTAGGALHRIRLRTEGFHPADE